MTPSPDAATDGPTLLTRLAAKLRGEVPAEALEAFRAAGGAVHPMLPDGRETAAGTAALGRHPYATRQDELLAVWDTLILLTRPARAVRPERSGRPARTA